MGWMLFPGTGLGDRIVLKDGTVEESDKIWTSDKFLHFILKGTQSVEIRYAIDIVERVERDRDADQDTSPAPLVTSREKTPPDTSRSELRRNSEDASSDGQSAQLAGRTTQLRRIESEGKGISFYDPRRSHRYQVSKTSAHNDLRSALSELAKIYGRTPDWVAAHMGEENDIQRIHHNLKDRLQAEMRSQRVPLQDKTLATEDHATSPHDAPTVAVTESIFSNQLPKNQIDDPELNVLKGIKFYDPRRKRKYWTGRSTHHGSLQEALENLARQYNAPPAWIEDHMGESNLLIEIHHSIRSSLPRD